MVERIGNPVAQIVSLVAQITSLAAQIRKLRASNAELTSSRQFDAERRGQFAQRLRHDGRVRKDGHEVRVAIPARDDVDVQMLDDARAGAFAEIDAEIEAVGAHDFGERVLTATRELHEVGHFLHGQSIQVGRLFVGHRHHVPASVGIFVEQRKTGAVPGDDVVGLVIIGLGRAGEDALRKRRLGREDVFDSPRGVEWFHAEQIKERAWECQSSEEILLDLAGANCSMEFQWHRCPVA